MTLEYYPETDTLYIALREAASADASEVAPDVVIDVDAAGGVVGITVEHASEQADLHSFSVTQIPVLMRAA